MANLGTFGAAVHEGDPDREPDTFEFYGETFTVKDRVGVMPLLMFAAVAKTGVDSAEMEAFAAMHALITACIVTEDVPRFEKSATDNDVETEQLMEVCKVLYSAVTGRPTTRPSDSADGSSTTTENSKALSYLGDWDKTPLGRRELAANPERYELLRVV